MKYHKICLHCGFNKKNLSKKVNIISNNQFLMKNLWWLENKILIKKVIKIIILQIKIKIRNNKN